jgi:hypothetical protein
VLDAFLAAEARAPPTLVITGLDGDDPRLRELGAVEVNP